MMKKIFFTLLTFTSVSVLAQKMTPEQMYNYVYQHNAKKTQLNFKKEEIKLRAEIAKGYEEMKETGIVVDNDGKAQIPTSKGLSPVSSETPSNISSSSSSLETDTELSDSLDSFIQEESLPPVLTRTLNGSAFFTTSKGIIKLVEGQSHNGYKLQSVDIDTVVLVKDSVTYEQRVPFE